MMVCIIRIWNFLILRHLIILNTLLVLFSVSVLQQLQATPGIKCPGESRSTGSDMQYCVPELSVTET